MLFQNSAGTSPEVHQDFIRIHRRERERERERDRESKWRRRRRRQVGGRPWKARTKPAAAQFQPGARLTWGAAAALAFERVVTDLEYPTVMVYKFM